MNNTDNDAIDFYDFGFDDLLLDSLDAMRFETATPVQSRTIPVIMAGNDLIACAQTGTGKTAAYLLPVINRLIEEEHSGVNTIILVPTRELAIQIDQQMEGFGYFVPVSSTAIYGGNDSNEWARQRQALETGTDIVIATPGRMLQHIAMGYVDFSNVQHLILDEADRMLDMGFHDDIMQVVNLLPKEGRQTLMFSATMPPKIRDLARSILVHPKEINIAISKPAEGIRQGAFCVYDGQKNPLVKHILKSYQDGSVIVFSSKKSSVKDLSRELQRSSFNVGVIHSDLDQKERENVLRDFKNRNINILVATDIIARGIDIEKIDLVINYDVPRDAEDYVHRIGRTARANTEGCAYTFVNEAEMNAFASIERLIEMEVPKEPLPEELGTGPEYKPKQHRRGGHRRGRHNGNRNKKGNNQSKDSKPNANFRRSKGKKKPNNRHGEHREKRNNNNG
jgi:superfamily II DNA/RNA helicase